MFNRQPFNRSSQDSLGVSGIALIKMVATGILNKDIYAKSDATNIKMQGNLNITKNIYKTGTADLIMIGTANDTKTLIISGATAEILLNADVTQSLSGEKLINLEGITIKPGNELIINTIDMTVTLNGQNAMEYFTNESEFFALLEGVNTLIYSDSNTSRNILFDVIWKDRWL